MINGLSGVHKNLVYVINVHWTLFSAKSVFQIVKFCVQVSVLILISQKNLCKQEMDLVSIHRGICRAASGFVGSGNTEFTNNFTYNIKVKSATFLAFF